MFGIILLLCLLYLLKQLHYPSLYYTGAGLSLVIVVICFQFPFIALHSETFSTSSLPISEDSGMVSFNYFVYQVWNS